MITWIQLETLFLNKQLIFLRISWKIWVGTIKRKVININYKKKMFLLFSHSAPYSLKYKQRIQILYNVLTVRAVLLRDFLTVFFCIKDSIHHMLLMFGYNCVYLILPILKKIVLSFNVNIFWDGKFYK